MSERDPEMLGRIVAQYDAWSTSVPEFKPRKCTELIADICAAEIVRELEALQKYPPGGMQDRCVDARLAALRSSHGDASQPPEGAMLGTEQSEVAAGCRAPERVENAQADLPAPASSLRDFVGDEGMKALAPLIRERLAPEPDRTSPTGSTDALRAQPTSGSADWIDRMVKDWLDGPDVSIAKVIRERLEPVVERLEHVAENTGATWVQLDIERALSLLRGEVKP